MPAVIVEPRPPSSTDTEENLVDRKESLYFDTNEDEHGLKAISTPRPVGETHVGTTEGSHDDDEEDGVASSRACVGDGAHAAADHFYCQPGHRPPKPFQKWMRTLHKRVLRQQEILGYDGSIPDGMGMGDLGSDFRRSDRHHHRHSSSDSSLAFVTAVKPASLSVTGISLLTRSRKTTIRSARGSRGPRTAEEQRSSRASLSVISGPRMSEDSGTYSLPEKPAPMDPAVVERALQRRRILEELISTEEGYIGDVRFLMNVYVTMLAALPTSPAGLRSTVNRNLTDLIELHEEVLGELHRAVPDSEYTQLDLPTPPATTMKQSNASIQGHRRWRSLDVVPEGRDEVSWLRDVPGMVAEPQAAAEVARVFLKRMNRFFVYEEYGAKYEMMIKDIAAAHRTMPGWASYQKGLEVLASSLISAESCDDQARRALSIGDLLVKPIQRVCKYPLLFSELLKHTPVIDCPYSHMEIENTLIRLREATAEINRATNDSQAKSVLEKTWILQDRLAFPDRQLDAASRNRIRSFGHLRLCGALHVCWQTQNSVSGQYMVALLYRDWLCLATAGRIDQIYTLQACISLNNIKVEEVDNGRGLQCHTAQHSWKIVFLSDNQLYELILTGCSAKEELEWRARLRNSNQDTESDGSSDQMRAEYFNFLSLNIKPLGTVFRKPGTMARKISVHRATTIGPKSPLYQVILKNTSAAKDVHNSSNSNASSPINRSQSLLSHNNSNVNSLARIPVLAPERAERARLEALLADVWTRNVLPFPGITTRSRSEHLVRASASSMMRKLSAVTMTGSFGRRTTSLASLPPGHAQAAAYVQQGGQYWGNGSGEGERREVEESNAFWAGHGYDLGYEAVAHAAGELGDGFPGRRQSTARSSILDRDHDRTTPSSLFFPPTTPTTPTTPTFTSTGTTVATAATASDRGSTAEVNPEVFEMVGRRGVPSCGLGTGVGGGRGISVAVLDGEGCADGESAEIIVNAAMYKTGGDGNGVADTGVGEGGHTGAHRSQEVSPRQSIQFSSNVSEVSGGSMGKMVPETEGMGAKLMGMGIGRSGSMLLKRSKAKREKGRGRGLGMGMGSLRKRRGNEVGDGEVNEAGFGFGAWLGGLGTDGVDESAEIEGEAADKISTGGRDKEGRSSKSSTPFSVRSRSLRLPRRKSERSEKSDKGDKADKAGGKRMEGVVEGFRNLFRPAGVSASSGGY